MAPAETPAESRRGAARGSRRRSREMALQALYEWLLTGHDAQLLCDQAMGSEGPKADQGHLQTLVHGVIEHANDLHAGIQPFLDRPAESLSPIEHALLLIGGYELTQCPEIPFRVVINEAVELAKSYGGTDGHKYVNGVLDKLAAQVRPAESKR
jgi:transcription antitermination protein NusB